MNDKDSKPARSLAPYVIFGGMLLIGISTVSAVVIARCTSEQELLDPSRMQPPRFVNPEARKADKPTKRQPSTDKPTKREPSTDKPDNQ